MGRQKNQTSCIMCKLFCLWVISTLNFCGLASTLHLRDSPIHEYWFTALRKFAQTGVPRADVAWNYCDLKCIYLEQLMPNTDFYVVTFQTEIYKPNFQACFGKIAGGTPKIWNQLIKNEFFEDLCGDETERYMENTNLKIKSQKGVGIGTMINY